jgi:hypothetical protein
MFAVSNIAKFIDDHPEIEELQEANRTEILCKAHQLSDPRGMLESGVITQILGKYTALFFEETANSLEHAELGLQTLRAMDLNRSLLNQD